MRAIVSQMKKLTTMRDDELMREAKELGAPLETDTPDRQNRQAAGSEFLRGRHRHSSRRGPGAAPGRGGGLRRIGHF